MIDLPTCPLTGKTGTTIIYEGPIRSGGADSGLESGYKVLHNSHSQLAWLTPFPKNLTTYYSSNEYWEEHHSQGAELERLRQKLDHEQEIWLRHIGHSAFRVDSVADFGAGPGIFLEHIKGLAGWCTGVDLTTTYKSAYDERGFKLLQFGEALENEQFDCVVSFDTLEHVPEPWTFLQSMHDSLKAGGHAYIGVPNLNDFLKQLVPGYLPFFYHKSHLWYFCIDALTSLAKHVGFEILETSCVHKYDLNNLIIWAKNGKPSGKQGSPVFDSMSDRTFIQSIERQGIGSHILVHCRRPPTGP